MIHVLVEVQSSRWVRADLRDPENTVQNECVIDSVVKIVLYPRDSRSLSMSIDIPGSACYFPCSVWHWQVPQGSLRGH